MSRMLPALLLLSLLLPAAARDSDRDHIAAERRAIEERHAAGVRDCRTRFVVTACIEALQQQRRTALAALRQQELQMDDADRQRRADARRRAIEDRRAEIAARPALPPSAPASAPSKAKPPPAPLVVRPPRDRSGDVAAAAQRASASERRRSDAAADRDRIADRAAKRNEKKPVAPLPPTPDLPK